MKPSDPRIYTIHQTGEFLIVEVWDGEKIIRLAALAAPDAEVLPQHRQRRWKGRLHGVGCAYALLLHFFGCLHPKADIRLLAQAWCDAFFDVFLANAQGPAIELSGCELCDWVIRLCVEDLNLRNAQKRAAFEAQRN